VWPLLVRTTLNPHRAGSPKQTHFCPDPKRSKAIYFSSNTLSRKSLVLAEIGAPND
jgi:hypothetical protein